MREWPDGCVDAIVTDPPYGLSFMGRDWDHGVPGEHFWYEALRVAKPGAHLVAFGGTRTHHRLMCAIEDAGWEIRDTLGWLYGSGFPKSLDVAKAIDRRPGVTRHQEFATHLLERRTQAGLSRADVSEAVVGTRSGACWNWEHHQFPESKWWPALKGLLSLDESWGDVIADAERERVGVRDGNLLAVAPGQGNDRSATALDITAPATPAAYAWQGYGTALKPAWEPVILARKPLAGTVAANVLEHGTGALNIDACRVEFAGKEDAAAAAAMRASADQNAGRNAYGRFENGPDSIAPYVEGIEDRGRWPANIVHDGSDEVLAVFPETSTSGDLLPGHRQGSGRTSFQHMNDGNLIQGKYGGDSGSAARFFYCAKATRAERDEGLGGNSGGNPTGDWTGARVRTCAACHRTHPATHRGPCSRCGGRDIAWVSENGVGRTRQRPRNHHPTVKPLALMRWLVRLVAPMGAVVLDPFAGSGTTGKAAIAEGCRFVLVELNPEYVAIAEQRLAQRSLLAELDYSGVD